MNTITTTADLLHEAIVEAVKTYDLDVSDEFYAIEDIGEITAAVISSLTGFVVFIFNSTITKEDSDESA